MTVPIDFLVTDSPQTPARLNTDQTFDARIVSDLERLRNYVRFHSSAMDHQSGKGTKISKHDTIVIEITEVNGSIPAIDELVDSLADYQEATIDLTSYDRIGEVLKFKMMDTSWTLGNVGCTHVNFSLELKIFP